MLQELINHWKGYCNEDNFIGIGSTRKVYRVYDYVVKVHLHRIGYEQSKNEFSIYNKMLEKSLHEMLAVPYYTDESISIQKYYKPIEMRDNQSFEMDIERDKKFLHENYKRVLEILDHEFACFDLKDSSNYGINEQGKLVLIDYGMTKSLYEEQWVPLAEAGILPQIDFDYCRICGIQKELRMYGENDNDKRCYTCGKQ